MGLCGSSRCDCGLAVGDGLTLSGSGGPGDPWVLGQTGWVDIDSGSESAASGGFTISFDSGVYSMLRLRMRGNADATGTAISLRINDDDTADLHYRNRIQRRASDGTVTNFLAASTGTVWPLGDWTGFEGCTADVTIFDTASSGQLGFNGLTTSIHTSSGAANLIGESWGRLQSARLVSSLRVLVDASDDITCDWWLEGYKA